MPQDASSGIVGVGYGFDGQETHVSARLAMFAALWTRRQQSGLALAYYCGGLLPYSKAKVLSASRVTVWLVIAFAAGVVR